MLRFLPGSCICLLARVWSRSCLSILVLDPIVTLIIAQVLTQHLALVTNLVLDRILHWIMLLFYSGISALVITLVLSRDLGPVCYSGSSLRS